MLNNCLLSQIVILYDLYNFYIINIDIFTEESEKERGRRSLSPAQTLNHFILKNNTDQPAAALVDNPLDGLLQFETRISGHAVELVVQPLVHQLMQGFAEDIGLPYPTGAFLKFFEEIEHQFL